MIGLITYVSQTRTFSEPKSNPCLAVLVSRLFWWATQGLCSGWGASRWWVGGRRWWREHQPWKLENNFHAFPTRNLSSIGHVGSKFVHLAPYMSSRIFGMSCWSHICFPFHMSIQWPSDLCSLTAEPCSRIAERFPAWQIEPKQMCVWQLWQSSSSMLRSMQPGSATRRDTSNTLDLVKSLVPRKYSQL